MADLERELAFYRQQCNELGGRALRLQEEQTRARREARRSQTVTRLIREVYQLADVNVSLADIGRCFLEIILQTLSVDRAALLSFVPEQGSFNPVHHLGFPRAGPARCTPPRQPAAFHFANSRTLPDPLLDCLGQAAGGPYLLWAYNLQAGLALVIGNSTEDQILHRPFEESDREIVDGALSIFIEISERKRAEQQITASLQEKEVLLKEIHHRVKNNLQIISSLLHLQAGFTADQKIRDILQDSESRVRSMALVHEKLYCSPNLAWIDFSDYVRDLSAYLFRSQNVNRAGVILSTRLEKVFLEVETAVPCGLLLSELVTNTLKHAFPNGRSGEVCIRLWADDGERVHLHVADNGCGLPPGLDLAATESLGLQLVHSLVQQLGGTVETSSVGGTEFRITFPVGNARIT